MPNRCKTCESAHRAQVELGLRIHRLDRAVDLVAVVGELDVETLRPAGSRRECRAEHEAEGVAVGLLGLQFRVAAGQHRDLCIDLLRARVLVMECTFLDSRKTLEAARAGCHIHLDEVIERADRFQNEHIVFMHLSQLYRPEEVAGILDRRVPPALRPRIIPFVPSTDHWPG